MTSASFTADEAITYSVAAPHWVDGGTAHVIRGAGWQPGWELGPVDRPAGGLIASVEHLMTWCRFQWTGTALDGSVILTPREPRTACTRRSSRATAIEDIALDWFVWQVDGVTVIGHGGLTAGYISDLSSSRSAGSRSSRSRTGPTAGSVNDEVRRWALHRFADLHETDPRPDPTLEIDPERFAGRYVHAFSLLTVTPGPERRARVVVTAVPPRRHRPDGWQPPLDPPFTCAFFADDHAVSIDPPGSPRVVRFGFDDGGRAAWLLWGNRRAPRVD